VLLVLAEAGHRVPLDRGPTSLVPPSIGVHSGVHHQSMAGLPTARARGLPKRLPKLKSFQRPEENSEYLAELKTPANNSDDVTVQSLGPQASAGKGSPRLWAMSSSLR
jgi:hypothetical protein